MRQYLIADDLIRQSGGSISKLEELLEHKLGELGANPVRIDIENPRGLRMPFGNESCAYDYWISGGYTSGGVKEAVINAAKKGEYTVKPVY